MDIVKLAVDLQTVRNGIGTQRNEHHFKCPTRTDTKDCGCYAGDKIPAHKALDRIYAVATSISPPSTMEAAIEELTKDPLHQPVQFYRTWDGKRAVSIGRSRWEAESFLAALQAAKEASRG